MPSLHYHQRFTAASSSYRTAALPDKTQQYQRCSPLYFRYRALEDKSEKEQASDAQYKTNWRKGRWMI